MGEKLVIQCTAAETQQAVRPHLEGSGNNPINKKLRRTAQARSKKSIAEAAYPYLSVHFRQEEKELLLEVGWQGVEGPRIYQGPKVGIDKNGPRCLKIYLFPSVALHLTCDF